jgi:O-antigen/teichoic acid export membrane protein
MSVLERDPTTAADRPTLPDRTTVPDRSTVPAGACELPEPQLSVNATQNDGAVSAAVRGLFRRDSVYLVLWAVQLGAAALCTPVTTRLLGPSRFGLVAASIAVMQVLVAVSSLSLQSAVQRCYARSGERDARRLITLAIASSLVVFVLASASGPIWAPALGLGRYPAAVRFAVAWASLTAISNAALGLLRSRDQLVPFATVSLSQSILAEALSLLLIVAVHRSASEYMLGELVAQGVAVAVALALTRPLLFGRRHLPVITGALRYSIPLVAGALAAFALEASDRLVLQHDLGSAAVARYAVAYNIGAIPILLLGVLDTVWMPRVFALADARVRDSVLKHSRDALYVLLIPVVAGLGIGGPILLHIWAPASYHPDGLLLVLALVAVSSIPVAGVTSHMRVLLTEGRTAAVAVATALAAGTNLVLNIVLVPRLGIEGSALATLLGYSALEVTLAIGAQRARRLEPTGRALRLEVLAAVSIAFAAAAAPVTLPLLGIRLVIGLLCLAVLASMISNLSGLFGARQPDWLTRWMRSNILKVPA